LVADGKKDRAIEVCEEIIKDYAKTNAAKEAKELLDKLNK
jgi:hypothetical protein